MSNNFITNFMLLFYTDYLFLPASALAVILGRLVALPRATLSLDFSL